MKISLAAPPSIVCALLSGALTAPAGAQYVNDNFNTNSSASYAVRTTADAVATFAFDYSALGIPPAPHTTDNTTLGLKLEANISAGAVNAVTLHTVQTFTGDRIVKMDAWINANGPFPLGGTGSTQYLTFGVGGNGLTTNGVGAGSGGWFAVDGEGQSTRDYRAYKNGGEQFAESGQFSAGTSSAGGGAHQNSDPYYAGFGGIDVGALLVQGANNGGPAQQTGITAVGSFGFEWHEITIVVDANGGTGGATAVTWFIDGLQIARLNAGIGSAFSSDGSVTLGYYDPFTSVSNNATLSFGLIDNLVIADLALAEPYGTNPPHPTFGAAVLGTTSRPVLGSTFACDLAYAGPAPEPAVLLIGGAPTSIPFLDGVLLAGLPWTPLSFFTTPPTTSFAFPIPFDPTISGGIASMQALVLDLLAPATPNGLVFSSALSLRLGL